MAPKPSHLGLGFKDDGNQACDYFWPSPLEFGAEMAKAECLSGTKAAPLEVTIPIPSGMAFRKAKNQLLLDVDEKFAARFRRAYGYVGEISYLQEDKDTPNRVADTGSHKGCRQVLVEIRPRER